jgi:hypothetical protein
LATPDICLIQGDLADARVRVAHVVAGRAAVQGESVLLLAREPAVCAGRPCANGVGCLLCTARASRRERRRSLLNWLTGLFRARPPTGNVNRESPRIVTATFGDPPAGPFDLVIALDAHTLSDADLASIAGLGRRLVLIGEPSLRSSFQRHWRRLAFDPWMREGEHIVCRLRPAPEGRRDELESEVVADRPEIELRILPEPNGVPQLAEVVFPARLGIADAKCFVFEQLGEAPLGGNWHSGGWYESAEAITLDLAEASGAAVMVVALCPGIREVVSVSDDGWTTCTLHFARSAGWSRETAEKWVEGHCGRPNRGRIVRLDRAPSGLTETVVERAAETLA